MNKLDLSAQEYFNFILNKRQKDWENQNSKIITRKEYPIPYRPKTRKPIEIPKDWVWMTIDQLTLKMNAGSTPRGGKKVYRNNGIMFIRSQNVQMGRLETKYIAYISKEIHQKMEGSKVYYGDVLLNITGASIGRITWFNLKNCEANVNQHVSVIRLVENIPDWIVLFFSTKWGQKQIRDYQSGSTRQGLNINNQKQLMFPLAPLKEQIKIISILNNLNKIIIGTQKIIKQLQLLKKGLMQRLFTEGIGHTEFKETKLGIIPKEWEIKILEQVISMINSGTWGDAPNENKKVFPILRSTEIKHDGRIDLSTVEYRVVNSNNLKKYILEDNDILIVSSSGSPRLVGRTSFFIKPNKENIYLFSNFMLRIRSKLINPKYLYYYLNSGRYKRFLNSLQQTATGLRNLPKGDLIKLKIPYPETKEQDKITEILTNIDKKIEQELEYIKKLKEIKKGLMNDLPTGKKRVNLE